MQLTLHATRPTSHGASRLVLAIFAWSVKTRRALSQHCKDARVYGHTTTAMHHNEYPPPPANGHHRVIVAIMVVVVGGGGWRLVVEVGGGGN